MIACEGKMPSPTHRPIFEGPRIAKADVPLDGPARAQFVDLLNAVASFAKHFVVVLA